LRKRMDEVDEEYGMNWFCIDTVITIDLCIRSPIVKIMIPNNLSVQLCDIERPY
jgi:hypothetical protein